MLGIAVQLHHHFGSKFVIDSLNSHGFCSSYSEVQRFEMSAAMSQGTDIPGLATGRFVQFVADNADHNVATLDGHNTFHGMGIIAAVTPGANRRTAVARCSARAVVNGNLGAIPIHFYKESRSARSPFLYERLNDIHRNDPTWKIDLLWKLVCPLRSSRPGWSGMMQAVHQDPHPGKAAITFLPMIDMNPNDMSCVYSTLRFVATECKRHEVTPILTFDQPLWWKGQLIIANEPAGGDLHALILRLGGFHAEMSLLGCIGSVMAASGLEELLGVVFAPNTVKHVLSGKALARAIRGHMLVDSALSALITEQTFPAATRSEASCGEPNNTIYQTTESTSAKELRETQPETGNDLQESLVLSDQIVSRKVTVATSVCSEQTCNIRSEASCGEPNNTIYQTTESTSAKELRETQPETDNDSQESLVVYDQIVAVEVTAATVCSEKVLDRIAKKVDDQKATLSCHPTARLWLQYMDMVALLR